ncbi:DUF7544 domain-containing protein [Methanogenium organophilum]|uniref:Transmembrane protein n=1 Tax=Methanogenium organophilum TaxID=2199 RepID=A0A9X9S251_METOG|nr:hypothetical protein [Methanogenium organophilum]WAI00157.1 hypothetical protein OU421_06855 [Methanogenium organophilum]
MSDDYYAFSEISGAVDRTKNLLWPFQWGVWFRIALIALFIGGGGFNFPGSSYGDVSDTGLAPGSLPDLGMDNIGIILIIVGVVLLLALIWMFIGSVLQFVFVDCLTSGRILLTRTFKERSGKGVRLLLFNIGIGLIFLLIIAVLALIFFLPVMDGTPPGDALVIGTVLMFVLLILVLLIPLALIAIFTTDFVVPVMIRDDCGVIAAWRQVIAIFAPEWKQAVVYVLVKFVLGIAAAILLFIAVLIAVIIIGIPFVIIGVVLATVFKLMNIMLLLLLLIPFVVIVIPVTLLIEVPFVTFFRYYSLQVLGRISEKYALLPNESMDEPAV